jgi:hypothetical protein
VLLQQALLRLRCLAAAALLLALLLLLPVVQALFQPHRVVVVP